MRRGDGFEGFLEAARADHAASSVPAETARRIEAALGERVSWRRPLPERAAAALEASAGASAGPSDGGAKGGASTWRPSTKALAALAPVIGVALVSYAVATSTPASSPAAAPPPIAPIAEATPEPPISAPSAAPDEAASVYGVAELPEARELPDAPPRGPSRRALPPARPLEDGTLEAELALLEEVNGALQGSRPERALTLIDEHERRFPRGALAPEFAAQRAVALAALGRHEEACARAASFFATYPKSPLIPQVRSSCVDSTSGQ